MGVRVINMTKCSTAIAQFNGTSEKRLFEGTRCGVDSTFEGPKVAGLLVAQFCNQIRLYHSEDFGFDLCFNPKLSVLIQSL